MFGFSYLAVYEGIANENKIYMVHYSTFLPFNYDGGCLIFLYLNAGFFFAKEAFYWHLPKIFPLSLNRRPRI
jgi:hypothetical protein